MKNKNLFSIILLAGVLWLSMTNGARATSINASGTISVNTTWSGVDTVKVTGNIHINNGVTLTVSPGICVYFMGHYWINVQGRLLAQGTESSKIKFTVANQSAGWNRIVLDNPSDANDTTKISYCTFEYGKANVEGPPDDNGGAVYIYSYSKVKISLTTFENNYAEYKGGAIYCESSDIQIRNCIFRDNVSDNVAGAIYIRSCSPDLMNCLFYANQGVEGASALWLTYSSNPNIINCSFAGEAYGNHSIYCRYNSKPIIRNTIFWTNSTAIYLQDDDCDPDFYYCDVKGGLNGIIVGYGTSYTGTWSNVINADPKFTGTGEHVHDLQTTSPCINAGDPATTTSQVGTTDLRGGTRIADGRVDIGAYEGKLPSENVAGNCLDFDGTNDYVNIGNLSADPIGNTLTIECWIKPNNLSGRQGIFSTRFNNAAGSFQLEVGIGNNGTNRLVVSGVNTWVAQTGDNVLIPGEWNHIAYTRSGTGAGTHTLYVNGEAQTLITDADYTFIDNTSNKVIGSGTNNAQFFNGKIEEMRVWSVVRTEQQIRESMHHPYIGNETGLTAYWVFNEQSGTSVADDLGNITGTTVNMDNSDWVASTIPFGAGAVSTNTEANGLVDFAGTGFQINYSAQNGASITVTRIDTTPNQVPIAFCEVFKEQYWVLNRYGSGTFTGNMTFTIAESIEAADEINPSTFRLYQRNSTSDNAWVLIDSASAVIASTHKVTFEDISATGQLIICKKLAVQGYPGYALDFDGIDDYVNCANSDLSPTAAVTVEAWINADTWKTNHWQGTIVGKDNNNKTGYTLRCGNNGKLSFVLGLNGTWAEALSDAVMQTGQWNHVAGVYDGASIKLYINGILSAQQAVSGNVGISSKPILIGESPGYSGRYFDGKIDEVRIWNIARSANQIRELMNIPPQMSSAGLLAWWQLNEGDNYTIYNLINSSSGVFTNMNINTAWVNSTIPFGKGVSNSQVEASGNVVFTGTGVTINYTTHNGASVTLARIDTIPNLQPVVSSDDSVYQKQYWILNRFGTGNFNAVIQFTVGEDIKTWEETYPNAFKLYTRTSNSTGNWTLIDSADVANASENKVSFTGLNVTGQFIICRSYLEPVNPRWVMVKDIPEFSLISDQFSSIHLGYSKPEMMDFNRNGLLDLLVGTNENKLFYYVQSGQNSDVFSYQTDNFSGISSGTKLSISSTDIDHDNLFDLIIGEENGNLNHFEQSGFNSSVFSLITENFNGINLWGINSPEIVDLDGDGLLDLLVCNGGDIIRWWEQAAPNSQVFNLMSDDFNSIHGIFVGTPEITDLYHDGILDLFFGNYNGTLYYYRQNSEYSNDFSLVTSNFNQIDVGGYSDPNFSDIDNDLLPDLLIGAADGNIRHYEQAELDSIQFPALLAGKSAVRSYTLIASDLDSDLSLTCTGQFSISLSPSGGFSGNLLITPVNNEINQKIFVQFNPLMPGMYTGEIIHTYPQISDKTMILTGTVGHTGGFPGTALNFDGDNDYVNCGTSESLNFTNNITVEAWINADTWKDNAWQGTIVARDANNNTGFALRCGNEGVLSFVVAIDGDWKEAVSGYIMETGQWYHVAGVYDGSEMRIFINGTLSGQFPASGIIGISSQSVYVGESPAFSGRCFDGKIDEVRIWNVARTPDQIREDMHLPVIMNDTGLVGYWQMNEGSGNTTDDLYSGNLGTLTNMDINAAWVNSTIPFGNGFSFTQTEAPGNVDFTGTGVSVYYWEQAGAVVTATRIDTLPNQLPSDPVLDLVYQKQYWVISRYGTGFNLMDITFTLQEDLTTIDQNNADKFRLFGRDKNSDGYWTLVESTASVNHLTDQVTFDETSFYGQYIIAREPYSEGIFVNIVVNLQGPFNGTVMNTTLNSSAYLPLTQPYSLTPWNYSGTENVTAIPNVNIVDWVLVELRDAVDAASATSASVVAQQAAFILNNGTITGIDGVSPLSFMYTPVNSLFAVVYHRNTIAVMSSGPLTSSGSLYSWDFTTSGNQAYGGTGAQKELTPGIWGMYAGDGNADGQINNGDKNEVWALQSGTSGYLSGDFNLDSQVNNSDKNDLWKPNTGQGCQVPQ